jgi:hypothetical protein
VTDAHIAMAIAEPGKADESSTSAAQNPAEYPAVSSLPKRESIEGTKGETPGLPGLTIRYNSLQDKGLTPAGLEPATCGLEGRCSSN